MERRSHSALVRQFARPELHQTTSAIIARHSTNHADVREVALAGLDLSTVHRILDLGCGFGFMAEAAAWRAAASAHVTGVDLFAANREPFLARIRSTGREGSFIVMRIEDSLPWATGSFDLALATYSLYFFPSIVSEIARVLKNNGAFVALTHSERSFAHMLQASGLSADEGPLPDLLRAFSAENGAELLGPHFRDVTRVDYPNELVFAPSESEDLLTYLAFKAPFLAADAGAIARPTLDALTREGRFVIEKDDAVFRCKGPIHP